MNYSPKDAEALFRHLGANHVQKAVVNDEFDSALAERAEKWLAYDAARRGLQYAIAGVASALLVGLGTIVATLAS